MGAKRICVFVFEPSLPTWQLKATTTQESGTVQGGAQGSGIVISF